MRAASPGALLRHATAAAAAAAATLTVLLPSCSCPRASLVCSPRRP